LGKLDFFKVSSAPAPAMDKQGSAGIGAFLIMACQALGDALGVSPQAISSTLV
jgi:hypothetical protein